MRIFLKKIASSAFGPPPRKDISCTSSLGTLANQDFFQAIKFMFMLFPSPVQNPGFARLAHVPNHFFYVEPSI